MISEGSVLAGRFEVLAELGRGGTARVFKARDRVVGQDVALKVLHGHLATEPLMRDRLRREVQACRRMVHPAILPVYDLYEDGGELFLAMAYHPGMTLDAAVAERGPLSVEEARRLGMEVAAALELAHGQGVLHRDIKPQNLLLDAKGEVQLTDFGFARLADLATLTASSQILGTPGYVAPEIYAGGRWEPRSDLYSVGAVLYEALTGRPPFRAPSPLAVLQAQVAGAPPAPSTVRPEVPRWMDALILSLLAVDPDDRPDGAGALRDALNHRREPALVEPRPVETAAAPPPLPTGPTSVELDLEEEEATQREERVTAWVSERLGDLRESWAVRGETSPDAAQAAVEPVLHGPELEDAAHGVGDTWAEVVDLVSGADRRRMRRYLGRRQLPRRRARAAPHTWMRAVMVYGMRDPSGELSHRRELGPYRARLTVPEARRLAEILAAHGLPLALPEADAVGLATGGAPFRAAAGLPVVDAWRLWAALQEAGFAVALDAPRYHGSPLRLGDALLPVLTLLLVLFTPLPLLFLAPALAWTIAHTALGRPRRALSEVRRTNLDAPASAVRKPIAEEAARVAPVVELARPAPAPASAFVPAPAFAPAPAPAPGTPEPTPAGVRWPSGWPTRAGAPASSAALKLAYRTLARIGQIEACLTEANLPVPALVDLKARLEDARAAAGGLVGAAMGLERALTQVDEGEVVRHIAVLEQRRRRLHAEQRPADSQVDASLTAQRGLVDHLREVEGELARHMARLMALSATLDSLSLSFGRGGPDLDGLAALADRVGRLGQEIDAARRLLGERDAVDEALKVLKRRIDADAKVAEGEARARQAAALAPRERE